MIMLILTVTFIRAHIFLSTGRFDVSATSSTVPNVVDFLIMEVVAVVVLIIILVLEVLVEVVLEVFRTPFMPSPVKAAD